MEVRIKGIKLETMAARQLPFQIVKLIWLTRPFSRGALCNRCAGFSRAIWGSMPDDALRRQALAAASVCQVEFKAELPCDLLGATLEAQFVAGSGDDGGTPTVGVVLANANIYAADADPVGNHLCELLSGLLLFGHVIS
jgi:hypothetical protein